MSTSVVSIEQCPICKEEEALYEDYDIYTQETLRICNRCGYKYHLHRVKDADGNLVQPIKYEECEEFGGGVIDVESNDSKLIATFTMPRYSTKEDVLKKIEAIKQSEHNIKRIQATWFDEENGILKDIL